MGSVNKDLPWEQRVAKKRLQRADKIPTAWRLPENFLHNFQTPLSEKKNNLIEAQAIRKSGILTEKELRITEDYNVSELLSALADGTLTSFEVTLAYSKRAAIAQQLVSIPKGYLATRPPIERFTDNNEGELSDGDYVRRSQRPSSISRHSSGARAVSRASPWPSN